MSGVRQLRVVVTAEDYDEAVAFYRDVLGLPDAAAATARLAAAGARVIAEPVRTPWSSLNARLEGPAGLQLTLFEELS